MTVSIFILFFLPIGVALIIPLLYMVNKWLGRITVAVTGSVEFLVALFIFINNFDLLSEEKFALLYDTGWGFPFFTIHLTLDGLGLLFSLIVSLALALIIIYSVTIREHEPLEENRFYSLLLLVLGIMQGTIMTGDILNLFIFFELMTIISTPLIAFEHNQISTEAAIKYLIYGLIGGIFFLLGIIFIWFNLKTLNMGEIANGFNQLDYGIQISVIIFFLLGLLIKLGIFPFHFWIPLAHSACPSSISALLSGVLLEIYLYIFLRVFWFIIDFNLLQGMGIDVWIIYLGLLSSLIGHFFALQAEDIKRMLAFSTVGNIGLIMAVFSLNTEMGLYAGLLHVIAHMLMKSALFTGTGYLLKFTPSHLFKDFRGVAYRNQGVFISCIIVMLGMIGLPPLIGFISKWYILLAFLHEGHYPGIIVVILGSVISVVYYFRYVSRGYEVSGVDPAERDSRGRKPVSFHHKNLAIISIYLFAGLIIFTGVLYKMLNIPLSAALRVLLNTGSYLKFVLGG